MYMAKEKREAFFSLTLQSSVGQLAAFLHTVIPSGVWAIS